MAFQGIFPSQALVPASFGLLSVADLKDTASLDPKSHWLQGYSVEFDSRPQKVSILSKYTAALPSNSGIVYQASVPDELFEDIDPFFIQVDDKGSAMGLLGQDRFSRILNQLEATTQKALEFELWTGAASIEDGAENPYLTQTTSTVLTTGGVAPKKALYLIEGALSNSPTGAGGVIHVSRDVASTLTLQDAIRPVTGPDGVVHLETVLGTKVIAGTGYLGNGPGLTDATATNKWIYATGPVSVTLGDPEVVEEDLNRAFTPATNDVYLTAIRAASVYFDPSVFYAAQVTLPDIP